MDAEQARFNMVECQARTWDVLDDRILDAMVEVRREDFVPETHRNLAFADLRLPIGHGEVMLEPKLEGRILQEVAPRAHERALVVGAGTGHFCCLLSRLVREVLALDIRQDFISAAAARLRRAGAGNVRLECRDGCNGTAADGPFDIIIFTGSLPHIHDEVARQLRPGGRLFAVVGRPHAMSAWLIERGQDEEESFSRRSLFEIELEALACPREEVFSF